MSTDAAHLQIPSIGFFVRSEENIPTLRVLWKPLLVLSVFRELLCAIGVFPPVSSHGSTARLHRSIPQSQI